MITETVWNHCENEKGSDIDYKSWYQIVENEFKYLSGLSLFQVDEFHLFDCYEAGAMAENVALCIFEENC